MTIRFVFSMVLRTALCVLALIVGSVIRIHIDESKQEQADAAATFPHLVNADLSADELRTYCVNGCPGATFEEVTFNGVTTVKVTPTNGRVNIRCFPDILLIEEEHLTTIMPAPLGPFQGFAVDVYKTFYFGRQLATN